MTRQHFGKGTASAVPLKIGKGREGQGFSRTARDQ